VISTPAAIIPATSEHRAKLGERLAGPVETTLIVVGLGLLFWLPHNPVGDGWARFGALSTLLDYGELPDTKYSMVGPLFSTPLWFLGTISRTPWWWTSRFNVIVLGAGLLCICLLLKDRLPRELLRRFCLLVVAASMFANHLLFYYGEVFNSVLVAVGCVAIVVGRRLAGWITVVVGVINAPATLAGLVTLNGRHILATRRLRYALTIVVAVDLIMLEAWIRRGHPFDSGYAGDNNGVHTVIPHSGGTSTFSTPIFFGLLSLLFSFGKGLLFFAPGLLLPVRKILGELRQRTGTDIPAAFGLWVSFLVGLLLVYSTYWSWSGRWFWGPRYLLFASIPASFALAVCLHRRDLPLPRNLLTLAALCLSLWVGIDGVAFGAPFYGDEALVSACVSDYNGKFEEPLCSYTPEFSVLWFPFTMHSQLNPERLTFLVYGLVVALVLTTPLLVRIARQLAAEAHRAGGHFRF
jgi:hypothetical protein